MTDEFEGHPRDDAPNDDEDGIVEFVGGPEDGLVADTRSDDHVVAELAKFVCMISDHGRRLGKRFGGMAVEQVRRQKWDSQRTHGHKVIDRRAEAERVRIRVEYDPA
jgi:hypothetical protein